MRCQRIRRILVVCAVMYTLSVLHLIVQHTLNIADKQEREPQGFSSLHLMTNGDKTHSLNVYKPTHFNVSQQLLQKMEFPLRKFVHLDDVTVTQFVFVTAASEGFMEVAHGAVASVQKYYPDRKIIFYNLGSSKRQKKRIMSMCNVEYRDFDFIKYPPHVRDLHLYTWKPLIIYEVLKEYPGVFWLDSSVRFLSDDVNMTYPKLLTTGGALLFNYAGHSTFVVTHNATYEYIPSNITALQSILQYEANIMMLYGTPSVFNDVIKWWVLCALVERCMAPVRAYTCHKRRPDVWAGCHRYDQTVINILLANKYHFDYTLYAKHYDNFEVIKRNERSSKKKVKLCPRTDGS